jgi:hypothetical protein
MLLLPLVRQLPNEDRVTESGRGDPGYKQRTQDKEAAPSRKLPGPAQRAVSAAVDDLTSRLNRHFGGLRFAYCVS